MSNISKLSLLGVDILADILNLLPTSSLWQVSRVSRLFKNLSDKILYRVLELSNDDKKSVAIKTIVDRLVHPSDALSQHVRELRISGRDLKISGINLSSPTLDVTDVVRVIGSLSRLHSFSWDVPLRIPESLLKTLERKWPNAHLHVTLRHHGINDIDASSSPLLHSLGYAIHNYTATVGATNQLAQYSRFPELKNILLASPNLRKLNIEFNYNWIEQGTKWPNTNATPHLLQLPLIASDRLPTLTDLSFSGPPETYEFDLAHCQLLHQCMDWSHLTRLDIGISCPQHFFQQIGPSLCSLRSLTMGIRTGDRSLLHWWQGPLTCEDLNPVQQFLKSIPGLYELCILDMCHAAEVIAPVILSSQRKLRKFSYVASMHRNWHRPMNAEKLPYTWTYDQIYDLCQQNPDLFGLEINFPLEDGHWPSEYAISLAQCKYLRSLKVVMELDEAASDFGMAFEVPHGWGVITPPLNETLARDVTENLFKNFFTNSAYSWLKDLEVYFTRVERDNRGEPTDLAFPIVVEKLERDDAPNPIDGGFTTTSPGKWLGGGW